MTAALRQLVGEARFWSNLDAFSRHFSGHRSRGGPGPGSDGRPRSATGRGSDCRSRASAGRSPGERSFCLGTGLRIDIAGFHFDPLTVDGNCHQVSGHGSAMRQPRRLDFGYPQRGVGIRRRYFDAVEGNRIVETGRIFVIQVRLLRVDAINRANGDLRTGREGNRSRRRGRAGGCGRCGRCGWCGGGNSRSR